MKIPLIRPTLLRVRDRYAVLEGRVERLRTRFPFLPRSRVMLSLFGVLATAAILYVGFKTLLAPKETFTNYEMPFVQSFDDVNLRRWFKHEGVWTIREGTLAQTIGGEHAAHLHLPYRLITDQPYHMSVFVTMKKDTRAAGMSFNAQYPDMVEEQHRVFIARPQKDRLELVAGYMDKAGSFVPQAQVPLDVNTTEFRIDVFVYDKTYLVLLNGQRLVEKRPLSYYNGLIGFYALGPANFDALKLTAADTPNPGNMVYSSDFDKEPGGAGWVPFNGTWRISDGRMVQSDPTVFDAGIGYETSTFQNYTLRATMQHSTGVGAGLLFNMPSPYQLGGAQVVRFSDETDAIVWGYYDKQNFLVRQGFKAIDAPGVNMQNIQVFSGENSYDLYLNERLIARSVPLTSTQGHVGLITSRSAAAFNQVEVFPIFGVNGAGEGKQLTPVASKPTSIPGVSDGTLTNTVKLTETLAGATPAVGPATDAAPPPTRQAATATRATANTNAAVAKATATPATANAPAATVIVAGTRNSGSVATVAPTRPPKKATTAPKASATAPKSAVTGGTYSSDFNGAVAVSGWRINSGDWSFDAGKFVQRDASGFDSHVVYTRQTFDQFSIAVTFAHDEGSGAGVLFNIPNPNQLAGAHMVRYSERRSNAIIWGYYDESGRFKGQGFADVEPASTAQHTLRVVANGVTYGIFLDDKAVVENMPLQSDAGYIGLITTRSSAGFDSVDVGGTTAKPREVQTTTGAFDAVRILNGTWTAEKGVFKQTVPNLADYLVNTGMAGSVFTAEAKITLSNTPDVGAGFIFHMSDRGSKRSAYVVRLRSGGKGIWWGSTDETGRFKGQGSTTLKPAARTVVLTIVVRGDRADIIVNKKVIVTDVAINRGDGWIGLLAYGGPVTFENLRISVEQ
jgi:hypothetical protein